MREIKFRAWDKKGKGFINGFNMLGFSTGQGAPKKKLQRYNSEWSEDDVILMQFTGLKDKNGVEIYEGDILEHNPDDDEWYDTVIWWEEKARFELKSFVDYPLKEMAQRYKKDKLFKYDDKTAMSMAISNRNCTMLKFAEWTFGSSNPSLIVGNIHEHKNLLDTKAE